MSDKTDKIDFEKSLAELEKIVTQLESGECSLDESITLFKKGITLSNDCSKKLENARQQILTLTEAQNEAKQ